MQESAFQTAAYQYTDAAGPAGYIYPSDAIGPSSPVRPTGYFSTGGMPPLGRPRVPFALASPSSTPPPQPNQRQRSPPSVVDIWSLMYDQTATKHRPVMRRQRRPDQRHRSLSPPSGRQHGGGADGDRVARRCGNRIFAVRAPAVERDSGTRR
jgi:hypothetical protein